MYDYLKKILFTLLILGVPYMNTVSKAMDVEDHEGSTLRARTVPFVTEDRQDVQFFKQHSTNSPVISLEDSKISWTSYLSSSVISAAQKAYNIGDYTTRNPQKAAIIGVFMAAQVVAVAADCDCWCTAPFSHDRTTCKHMSTTIDAQDCELRCLLGNRWFCGCN